MTYASRSSHLLGTTPVARIDNWWRTVAGSTTQVIDYSKDWLVLSKSIINDDRHHVIVPTIDKSHAGSRRRTRPKSSTTLTNVALSSRTTHRPKCPKKATLTKRSLIPSLTHHTTHTHTQLSTLSIEGTFRAQDGYALNVSTRSASYLSS
jgi:hypothetical protein